MVYGLFCSPRLYLGRHLACWQVGVHACVLQVMPQLRISAWVLSALGTI